MKKTTVLIIDASPRIGTMFSDMLNGEDDIEVIGTAIDLYDAGDKIKMLNPDVLTLDIEMPRMDSLNFLEKIMILRPMPVIMASTLTEAGASATIRALELGAVDYVFKPPVENMPDMLDHLRMELVTKVRLAATAKVHRPRAQSEKAKILAFLPPTGTHPVIAFGSSTGGVEALHDIFLELPANSPPIVVTQHLPPSFTTSFAARLDSLSQVTVAEAYDGARLQDGYAWIAPGDKHLSIARQGKGFVCRLSGGPLVSGHRPSVDVMFMSVAQAVKSNSIGVILTGMGKDGAQGLFAMRQSGAYTIAQEESSCVVYGMPRAAHACGAVQREVGLHDIAAHVLRYCGQERKGAHTYAGT